MEFFASIGTVGALVVAIFLLRREADRDQARNVEKRAEQASRVAGWVDDAPTSRGAVVGRSAPSHACILLNSSPLPVYGVLLVYWAFGEGCPIAVGTERIDVLPPGEKTVDISSRVLDVWRRHKFYPTLQVETRFTDSSGRRWWRTFDGVLVDKGGERPEVIDGVYEITDEDARKAADDAPAMEAETSP